MNPVMNNTKWHELRTAMLELAALSPRWRTRDVKTGYESSWDGEWFYHFAEGGYACIEWLEIECGTPEQTYSVQAALSVIHVPGELTAAGFKVYGHVPSGAAVEYIPPPPNNSFKPNPLRRSP